VINRKKKIILIQVTIFLFATSLFYYTYREKKEINKEEVKIKAEDSSESNSFENIKYSGFDLSGNRYTLEASKANFETETPNVVKMKGVVANFYFKDDTILEVTSDEGLYNNITLDMEFNKKVRLKYLTNIIFSDKLNYSNLNSKLVASGNVQGESVEKGKFIADNVEYNLSNKTLDFSMFGNKQVNVKLKN